MSELFAFGTIWFWLLVTAEVLFLFGCAEYENGLGATVSVVAFGMLLQWMCGIDIIGFMSAHPIQILFAVLAYLGIGLIWGIFKWRRLCKEKLREHDEKLADFVHDKGLPAGTTVLPAEHRKAWTAVVEKTRDHYKTNRTIVDAPLVRHHKARVTRWMSMWVFGLFLYLFKDMVKETFMNLYMRLAGFLQRMSDNMFSSANVKQNIEPPDDNVKK